MIHKMKSHLIIIKVKGHNNSHDPLSQPLAIVAQQVVDAGDCDSEVISVGGIR